MANPSIHEPEYIESNGFIAEIIRTKRIKSADIRVEEGAVSVVVPQTLARSRIIQLLTDRKQCIKQKIVLHREASPVSEKQSVSGEAFSYLGRNYRLKLNRGSYTPVKLIQGRLVVTMPYDKNEPHMIRKALMRWFKLNAERKLIEKVKRYESIVGVESKGVGIKSFKSRWGSCSAKGKIDFNWNIITAPNYIVDYVVAHELCHLKYHDHSPKFWKQLERVIPDYQSCKEWLKVNGAKLDA